MTILLTLLSLLATDCRVHRADSILYDWGQVCSYGNVAICKDSSHYIDTCKMRCDTVWTHRYWLEQTPDGTRGREDSFRVIDCYPDTAESDSLASMGLSIWPGEAPPPPPDTILKRYYPAPLDSAELSDIREMLREWRVEKCYKATVNRWERWDIFEWEKDAIRDSCRCLYERKDVR